LEIVSGDLLTAKIQVLDPGAPSGWRNDFPEQSVFVLTYQPSPFPE
jgi:hypothetical protein